MKHIIFIIGSERKDSFNRQLAKEAEDYIKGLGKAEVEYVSIANIPFINQDFEFPTPDSVSLLREKISKADGIWIFTPEYNYSYPGMLKNALDWLSRPIKQNDFASGTAIKGKKIAISGIGGKNATAGAREKLSDLLTFIKAEILPETEGFSVNPKAFSTNVIELSEEDKNRIYLQADKFLEFI